MDDRRFVQQSSPQPQIAWSLINGTGVDPYAGLDQFNRVVDNRWYSTTTNADLDRIQHGYNRAGNRMWRKNTVAEAAGIYLDELYCYDGIYRAQEIQRGQLNTSNNGLVSGTLNFAQAWGLDATGNWEQFWENDSGASWNMQQSRAANQANEITSITGVGWVQPAYDAAGNMVQIPQSGDPAIGARATYDAWSRLISIFSGGSFIQQNAFDGENRRATDSSVTELRHYYYTTRWQDIEERLGAATTADRQFIWGLPYMDALVLRDRGTERLFALHDGNWNVTAIVDTSGVPQERFSFTAYGLVVFWSGSFQPMASSAAEWETLFAGYRLDSRTGLHLARNRFLHSTLGRWLNRDPSAARRLVPNLYAYVEGQQIRLVDGLGLYAAREMQMKRP